MRGFRLKNTLFQLVKYTHTCPKGVVGFTACQATGSTKGATMRESCTAMSYNVVIYIYESRLWCQVSWIFWAYLVVNSRVGEKKSGGFASGFQVKVNQLDL